MNHYLYAIVDRMPTAWHPPTSGLGDASVVPRRVHDVVILGSLLDIAPPATPRTLAIHHDIVATVIEATALLPFRYGTLVPAVELGDWMAGRRAVVDAALAAVRDRVEMSVKLLRLDCTVDPRERRGAEPGPGARELQALAEALVERAGLPQWRYRPTGATGNVAASIAFLVPRPEMADFLARIAPIASRAAGVAVVPTGPWPPYSFVPDLERSPLARVPADRGGIAANRRVG
ncbi:MAG TPA: GvpL/GvpF family gas vesicle protein [Methylomirabilota bacterium]|nr:GvpL/GvpF family gas vesicle protein [Methylomirabilota bacterium]